MKKLISTAIIAVVAIIALASCNKQDSELISPKAQAAEIALSIDTELSLETLGLLGLNESQLKALQFDLTGSSPKISNSTDGWKTHLFLRKKGNSAEVGYIEYHFRMDGFTPADSQGKKRIKLKGERQVVTVHNITTHPKAGEEWYIIGMLGGGRIDQSKTRVDFLPDPSLDTSLEETQARVPLATNWTKLSISSDGALSTKLTFVPQGVLINVVMTNNKYDTPLVLEKSQLVSSTISNQGYFDFSVSQNPETDILASHSPKWKFTEEHKDAVYKLSSRLEKGKRSNTLIWGMPTHAPHKLAIEVFPYSVKRVGTSSLGFVSTEPLSTSTAYRINVEIDRPKTPLEYVADYNLAGGSLVRKGNENTPGVQGELRFAGDHLCNTSGYYDWYRSMGVKDRGYNPDGDNLFDHEISIKNEKGETIRTPLKNLYHIPSLEEWSGIFGNGNPTRSQYGYIARYSGTDAVTIAGVQKTYKSEVKSEGTGIGYAIRLMNASGAQEAQAGWPIAKTNDMRTAYRYERSGNLDGNDNNARLKVKSVYLGASFTGDINTISDEAWWQAKEREGLVITREFSASGHITGFPWGNGDLSIAGTLEKFKREGVYLSSTGDTSNKANFWSFYYNDSQAYGMSLFKHEAFTIRPFLNY